MCSEKKNQYRVCFIRLEILCNLKGKKSSHLDLSMQSYVLLKFELQNCVNSEAKRKGQKLNCKYRILIVTPNKP